MKKQVDPLEKLSDAHRKYMERALCGGDDGYAVVGSPTSALACAKKMEQLGYVTTEVIRPGRSVRIRLTPEGRALAERVRTREARDLDKRGRDVMGHGPDY